MSMTLHLTLSLRAGARDAPLMQQIARAAEQAKLDAILLPSGAGQLDPLPLVGSLIAVTRQIGLAAGWTIDFTEPYHVARVFGTLDHLSYGRTAWIAEMFGTERLLPLIGKPPEADDVAGYCARAGEFIDVVTKLWDSWEDEGFALDKVSGMFADPDRVHPINHAGQFFTVRGPLNVPRPPQGNPPLVLCDPPTEQARCFVATTADVIITDDGSAARCQELRALANGRDVRVLANLRYERTEPAQLVERFARCACDGFNLIPAAPDDVEPLLDAIRLAQRAGLFRREYEGTTLREHLKLRRPRSLYAAENAD
jgi:alkanesulfonate monooxygenase SsuD/methylene tetrahydromethanopterin reductase-like flavin-dependent oxidoreductase (luciferase family)